MSTRISDERLAQLTNRPFDFENPSELRNAMLELCERRLEERRFPLQVELERREIEFLQRMVNDRMIEAASQGIPPGDSSSIFREQIHQKLIESESRAQRAAKGTTQTFNYDSNWERLTNLVRNNSLVNRALSMVEGGYITRHEATLLLAVGLAEEAEYLKKEAMHNFTLRIPETFVITAPLAPSSRD